MFQFPGLPPHWLCVHQWVIGHYSNGVFLFGDPCVFVCLRLSTAFRSLPRPSSALSAKASTACPYLLNLLLSCAYSSYFLEVITICSEKFFCVYVRKTHRLSFFHFWNLISCYCAIFKERFESFWCSLKIKQPIVLNPSVFWIREILFVLYCISFQMLRFP